MRSLKIIGFNLGSRYDKSLFFITTHIRLTYANFKTDQTFLSRPF